MTDYARIITPVLQAQGIKKAAFFGSFVKNKMTAKSDLDILLQLPPTFSILDLSKLRLTLSRLTKKKVDLVSYRGLNQKLKNSILKDEKVFYEQV